MMNIYVPSYQRTSAKELQQGPLTRLPPSVHGCTWLVVREEEGEKYRAALDAAGLSWVQVHAVPIKGIAMTRHACGIHAQSMGVDKFMQIDDDVDFLVRRADDDWRLVAADHESVDQMLLKIEELLIDHGSVGVSSREGNNRAGVGGPGDLVARDTRLMRVYGCRTREFLEMEHGRVVVMDDFEFHVQMLRAGHRNACLFYWANGQRMTGSPGGCTDYRTLQVHHDSAVRFSELHPGFVRLRQKKNKGGGLAERTEVSVYWKRAAEEGARRKAGEIQ